jgi:lipopolysaccharide/colanic/teichoic acid biosynthesis glycosyltransferase
MSKIIQYENKYISQNNMDNDKVRLNSKKSLMKNNKYKIKKKNLFKKINDDYNFICYLLVLFILLLLIIIVLFQKNHIDNKSKLIKNKEKTNFNIIIWKFHL